MLTNDSGILARAMARKLHIATLGLHANERIDYVVTKKGADKIALIYSEKNEEDMLEIQSRFEARGIHAIPQKVRPWVYRDVLAGILEIAVAHIDYEIEYNISCGTRVMTAAAHQAALFTDSKVYFVLGDYDDPLDEIVEVQPLSVTILTEQKRNILSEIDSCGGEIDSQKQLGSRMKLGVSSISKHVKELDDSGYIDREKTGRNKSLTLTDLGRVILKLKQYKKGKACDGGNSDESK